MLLLEPAGLAQNRGEYAAHGGVVQRCRRQCRQAIEQRLLAQRIVDGKVLQALALPDGEHDPVTLGEQLQYLEIDGVDLAAQLLDFQVVDHGPPMLMAGP